MTLTVLSAIGNSPIPSSLIGYRYHTPFLNGNGPKTEANGVIFYLGIVASTVISLFSGPHRESDVPQWHNLDE